jgi:hypothetical protein
LRQEIEAFRIQRGIPYLLHFTREENLPSILSHGLASRSLIDNGTYAGVTNDQSRHDGRLNYNCLSISFPNHKMFFKLRNDNPNIEWPIRVIDPRILMVRRSLFCPANAASNAVSCRSDHDLETVEAFSSLFEELEGHQSRADQHLKQCDPTDVQAEVLVEGIIPPEAIYSIVFPSFPCLQKHAAAAGQRQTLVNDRRGMYGTREYYRKWGHGK